MSPPVPAKWLGLSPQWVAQVCLRDVGLEVSLADGARHLVRHPEHLSIRPDSGRVVIGPDRGPATLQVDPGEVVGLRAVLVDTSP